MKLAYMAEFAVAFNLAFGEFKYDKTAAFLDAQFESLDRNCTGPAAQLINIVEPETVAANTNSMIQQAPKWLGARVLDLEKFRCDRIPSDGSTYNALEGFVRRFKLFATNPFKLDDTVHPSKITVLWSVIKEAPGALLASLAYTNTNNWKFPPCVSSIIGASTLIVFSLLMLIVADNSGTVRWDLFPQFAFQVSSPIFALTGFITALIAPRPFSVIAAKVIGRFPPAPRGRYYSVITIVLVSLFLMGITLYETVATGSGHDFHSSQSFWLFSFGFLAGAMVLPVVLFAGYLTLESALERWAKWIEQESRKITTRNIEVLQSKLGSLT
ncbi:MAG: hypothetical protein HY847_09765 [Betaproteobacteria bacterium]|nr:hypothetical protein [Betaproteobacteria bacterium]